MASVESDDFKTKTVGAWARENQVQPKMQVIPQKNNLTDDIPTIPDIDDLADSTSKNILTPKMLNTTLMYEELDSELLKQYSYSSLDGVNMSPLLKFVHPDVHVKEPDTVWTVDSLFTDLAEYYVKEKATI